LQGYNAKQTHFASSRLVSGRPSLAAPNEGGQ
jgi:hypothetical protein